MKRFSYILLLAILSLSLSCTSKGTKPTEEGVTTTDENKAYAPNPNVQIKGNIKLVRNTDFYGNIERYAILEDSGKRQGKYLRLNPDSVLMEEASYNDGLLDGLRILYYENLDTQIVETHREGEFHGRYRSYYPDNHLKLEGYYTDNKMQGLWYRYYKTGEMMEEVTFVDNQENGPFTEFHVNGQVSVKGSYLNGDNEHGELIFYDEFGVHYKTMQCDNGLCRTSWRLEKENL